MIRRRLAPSLVLVTSVVAFSGCRPGPSSGDPVADAEGDAGDALIVRLDAEEISNAGLSIERVGPRPFAISLSLPASVKVHPGRRSKVVSRLSGVVVSVERDLGDTVEVGDPLLHLESRELAELRLALHEAHHHLEYLEEKFERARKLRESNLSAEQSFRDLEHQIEEARIEFAMARERLLLQGAPKEDVEGEHPEELESGTSGRYEMRSPFAGTIVSRSFVRGEFVQTDRELYELVDLSRLLVEVPVPTAQAASVAVGSEVRVESPATGAEAVGRLERVIPLADARSRSVTVWVELPEGEDWLPGMSVTATLEVAATELELAVPVGAVRSFEDGYVAFVHRGEGTFEARRVECGRRSEDVVEILSGLAVGEDVVNHGSLLVRERWLLEKSE